MARLRGTAIGATATAVVLLASRPDLSDPARWTGEQTALAAAWAIALACSAYLAVVSIVCLVAVRTRHVTVARCAAACAPRFVRRLVEVALVGALTVAPALPSFATTCPAAAADQPVVRAPTDTPIVRSRPQQRPTPTTTPQRPHPAPPASTVPPVRTPPVTTAPPTVTRPPAPTADDQKPHSPARPAPAPVPDVGRTHRVRPGDNLWVIARAELQRRGAAGNDPQTARYVRRVIAANLATLRSGDPKLIFPGEIVALPEPD